MFIGRERELNALDKLYKSGKFEFVVIYGRRRERFLRSWEGAATAGFLVR